MNTNLSTNASELCVRPLDGIGQWVYFFILSDGQVTLQLSRDHFTLVCMTKEASEAGDSADILRGTAQFEQIIVDLSERLVSTGAIAQMPPRDHTTRLDVSGITATEFEAAIMLDSGAEVPIAIGTGSNCISISVTFTRKTRVILRRVRSSEQASKHAGSS